MWWKKPYRWTWLKFKQFWALHAEDNDLFHDIFCQNGWKLLDIQKSFANKLWKKRWNAAKKCCVKNYSLFIKPVQSWNNLEYNIGEQIVHNLTKLVSKLKSYARFSKFFRRRYVGLQPKFIVRLNKVTPVMWFEVFCKMLAIWSPTCGGNKRPITWQFWRIWLELLDF